MSEATPRADGGLPRLSWARIERWLIGLVVLHSVGVGVMLLGAPAWSTSFAGWSGVDPLFFPRQAGVFHFVVAFAYAHELVRLRGVTILVVTKTVAFLFLMGASLFGETAWSVPFSGVADGLMGAAVLWVHGRVEAPGPLAAADHPDGA